MPFWSYTNFVYKVLDNGCEAYMVSLDFSATFDHIDHNLIFKLRELGTGGPFLAS